MHHWRESPLSLCVLEPPLHTVSKIVPRQARGHKSSPLRRAEEVSIPLGSSVQRRRIFPLVVAAPSSRSPGSARSEALNLHLSRGLFRSGSHLAALTALIRECESRRREEESLAIPRANQNRTETSDDGERRT